ncbi:MAG: hypothetical protein RSF82_13070 [Angelakisella sp.]
MELFTLNPTKEDAMSTERGYRFMTEPVAECRFYLNEMSIYQADDGSYYYHNHPRSEMFCYAPHQPELVSDLIPLGSSCSEQLTILEGHNAQAEQSDFELVTLHFVDDGDPMFVLYHPEQQTYFIMSKPNFLKLTPDVAKQLMTLDPAVNLLDKPHLVHLDENGKVTSMEVYKLC